jgi:RHS repeat-associated protein
VAQDSLGRSDTNTVTANLPTAVTFLYDQSGNLRTNGTRIFEYDDENQLTRITEPNVWKSEFTYDGKMKMRISKDYTWQGGAWVQTNEVRRVYDGMLVIQERDSLNLPRLTYTRGKDLSGSLSGAGGIGGLLALSDHKSQVLDHCYYHADGNGNVTCLVDANQTVVARYLFDPYGNTVSATATKSVGNKYRFSSKERNETSSMVYYGYRWYVPASQRWLNRDPIGEQGFRLVHGKPRTKKSDQDDDYGFLGNNPANFIDPHGTRISPACTLLLCCAAAGGAACAIECSDGRWDSVDDTWSSCMAKCLVAAVTESSITRAVCAGAAAACFLAWVDDRWEICHRTWSATLPDGSTTCLYVCSGGTSYTGADSGCDDEWIVRPRPGRE